MLTRPTASGMAFEQGPLLLYQPIVVHGCTVSTGIGGHFAIPPTGITFCASFRRRLAAARKQLARALHQLLFPVANDRRTTPNSADSSADVFSPDSDAIATRALNSALCCFLFMPMSHVLWTGQSLAYPASRNSEPPHNALPDANRPRSNPPNSAACGAYRMLTCERHRCRQWYDELTLRTAA
jgi:hypothetical protein